MRTQDAHTIEKGQRVRVLNPPSLKGFEGTVIRGCVAPTAQPGYWWEVQLDVDKTAGPRMFSEESLQPVTAPK